MQSADSTTEWQDAVPGYPFASDDIRTIKNGTLTLHQSGFVIEAEDASLFGGPTEFYNSGYSNGTALKMDDGTNGQSASVTWTTRTGR